MRRCRCVGSVRPGWKRSHAIKCVHLVPLVVVRSLRRALIRGHAAVVLCRARAEQHGAAERRRRGTGAEAEAEAEDKTNKPTARERPVQFRARRWLLHRRSLTIDPCAARLASPAQLAVVAPPLLSSPLLTLLVSMCTRHAADDALLLP